MIDLATAFIASALVLTYWYWCRTISLQHRNKAASLLEKAFNSDQVNDSEKDSIYSSYRMARHWFYMPLMTVLTPVVMAAFIFSGKSQDLTVRRSDGYHEAMDAIIKMAMSKNPILAAVCMSLTFASIAVMLPLGLLMNRITALPNLFAICEKAAAKGARIASLRHAH